MSQPNEMQALVTRTERLIGVSVEVLSGLLAEWGRGRYAEVGRFAWP
jgi:hypothetical protein